MWGFLWALLCGCAGGAVDIAALAAFDINPALKQFIGSMYEEFQADKAALRAELADERNRNDAQEKENQLLVGQVVGLQAALHEFGQLTNKTRADAEKMSSRLDQCEANNTQKRRAHEGEQVVGDAETVHIFKRSVSTAHLSGRVDESNGGHRLLGEGGGADCSNAEISRQISAINVECCDEPDEDCSNGKVHTCNAGCGALIMPLWTSCRAQLGSAAKVLQAAAAMCPPQDTSPTRMDVNMFMVTCLPGEAADDCIPMCEEAVHGYLLLLNINGEDAKLTCELHHDGYSWVGGASDGGYIGAVFEAFFSSVISGAAGTYIVTIMANQIVHTDVTIQPGQDVAINGDRALPQQPTWGSGGLIVAETGSLSLSYMQLGGTIKTDAGAAALTLNTCLLTSANTLVLGDGVHATFLGMGVQFGGHPAWVVSDNGATVHGRVCDAEERDCTQDLCTIVDCGGGGTCVSPQGTCACRTQHDGYSGDRCETHICCSDAGSHVELGAACGDYPFSCYSNRCAASAQDCDSHAPGWDDVCDRTC
eukprot:SAG11_NODE_328_length_10690_cov_25.464357_5_plen_536_part_00